MFRADLIRERRQALGVRPEVLAVAINRSAATVYLYESGQVTPPIVVLESIADALDTPVGTFFEAEAA